MRHISNEINEKVYYEPYKIDISTFCKLQDAKLVLNLDRQEDPVVVRAKVRSRGKQSLESLRRLESALIPCEFTEWLNYRRIFDHSKIFSLDFSKLLVTDLYDFYICPDDVYLDRYGDRPVIGPVFADYRDGVLAGICIRNLSDEVDYVSDVKYSFSNFGWFIWGYDDYDSGDEVIVVEGVFDALAMRSFGFNAVAVGCSAPTPMQYAMLLYKFKNLRFCFDNDLAGCLGAYRTRLVLDVPMCVVVGFKDVAQCWEAGCELQLADLDLKDLRALISLHKSSMSDGGRDLRYNV